MQVVSFVVSILHELEGFEVGPWDIEALEGEGAGLDAADYGVAGDGGGLRSSCLAEAFFAGFIGNSGMFEGAFSLGLSAFGKENWVRMVSSTYVTS